MKNSFDELSKKLGEGLSRRDMLKVAVAGILGTMLSPLGNEIALAAGDSPDSPDTYKSACRGVTVFSNCKGNHPTCCYCFFRYNSTETGCGANEYCSNIPFCNSGRCPKGYFCADTPCGPGRCLKKCRASTPCVHAVEEARRLHQGLTAAG